MGYHRAGFDVTGVDIAPQPNYPFRFWQADALEIAEPWVLAAFDVVHASPPCQRFSSATAMRGTAAQSRHPDYIVPIRSRLWDACVPYVIENVVGAPLLHPVQVCGESLGLGVRRHRLFESSLPLMVPPCAHHGRIVGVYGDHAEDCHVHTRGGIRRAATVQVAQEAMGMPWGEWREVAEAIPPAYTELIGAQLIDVLGL